jgi:hypothetical protein
VIYFFETIFTGNIICLKVLRVTLGQVHMNQNCCLPSNIVKNNLRFLISLSVLSHKYSKYQNKIIVIHDIKNFEERCIKHMVWPMSVWEVIYNYIKLLLEESILLLSRDV